MHLVKQPAVYIMASGVNGTLYTGVTSDLIKRVYQHKFVKSGGFTTQHHCNLLVYYTVCDDMVAAITEEKRIKSGSRQAKITRIVAMNPDWRDL